MMEVPWNNFAFRRENISNSFVKERDPDKEIDC